MNGNESIDKKGDVVIIEKINVSHLKVNLDEIDVQYEMEGDDIEDMFEDDKKVDEPIKIEYFTEKNIKITRLNLKFWMNTIVM